MLFKLDWWLKHEFLFPVRAEQQKIADCLSSLDELIGAEDRKLESLRAYKNGLMQQLFPREGETTPRLRFPEFRGMGEWKEKKAGSLFANRINKGEEGLPIYSVTMHDGMVRRDSFDRNFYDIEEAAGNKKACKNDLAYNMMRMWQGALGAGRRGLLDQPGIHCAFSGGRRCLSLLRILLQVARVPVVADVVFEGSHQGPIATIFRRFHAHPAALPGWRRTTAHR